MLTGTLVTIIGFIPVGFAQSTAGEYSFSLFVVIAVTMIVSWFVAVFFAPLFGVFLLSEKAVRRTPKMRDPCSGTSGRCCYSRCGGAGRRLEQPYCCSGSRPAG